MEEKNAVVPPSPTEQDTYSPGKQLTVGVAVTFFLVLAGFFIFSYLRGQPNTSGTNQSVLDASTNQISPIQAVNPSPQSIQSVTATTTTTAPASDSNTVPSSALPQKACAKNGPAQKWEYLTPYVVKDGDTLQSIASTQLNDASRVNEILQLNGQGPYVVGSTIYLPPPSITKSSGNIKEVYGMLVEKNASFWHVSYSTDPKGLGILIPSFWFDGIANSNSFTVGDCISVLFDDGNKVFSVALQ